MQSRPYKQVDVFTATPYLGNPLAVVLDGSDLSGTQMQSFARWTNLSETAFVLPPADPKADYQKCASLRPAARCRLPATPRWEAATPGWKPAANPRPKASSCSNAAWAW